VRPSMSSSIRRRAAKPIICADNRRRRSFPKAPVGHSVLGHLNANARHSSGSVSRLRRCSQPDPTGESAMTAASRSFATAPLRGALRERLAPLLHHQLGRDPPAMRDPGRNRHSRVSSPPPASRPAATARRPGQRWHVGQ
jgi:hypothetical protein